MLTESLMHQGLIYKGKRAGKSRLNHLLINEKMDVKEQRAQVELESFMLQPCFLNDHRTARHGDQ